MRIVTIGSKVFVTSFQLAGIEGIVEESFQNALEKIKSLMDDSSIGIILVSDDIASKIREKITELRAKQSTPLVFELPAPGSEKTDVDYRALLKKILGV